MMHQFIVLLRAACTILCPTYILYTPRLHCNASAAAAPKVMRDMLEVRSAAAIVAAAISQRQSMAFTLQTAACTLQCAKYLHCIAKKPNCAVYRM